MTLMAIEHSEMNTLPPTDFSYMSHRDQYSPTVEMPYVSHTLTTISGKSRSTL